MNFQFHNVVMHMCKFAGIIYFVENSLYVNCNMFVLTFSIYHFVRLLFI